MLKYSDLIPYCSMLGAQSVAMRGATTVIDANKAVPTDVDVNLSMGFDGDATGYELVGGTDLKVLQAGKYLVGFTLPFSSNATGNRMAWINLNGQSAATAANDWFSCLKKTAAALPTPKSVDSWYFQPPSFGMGYNDYDGTIDFMYKLTAVDPAITTTIGSASQYSGAFLGWHGQGSIAPDTLSGLHVLVQCADQRIGVCVNGSAVNKWAPVLALDTWYHIAITCSGASPGPLYTFYLNGVKQATLADPAVYTVAASRTNNSYGSSWYDAYFVRCGTDNPHAFLLQDMRVSNNVYFTEDFTPPTSRPVRDVHTIGLYPFNDYASGTSTIIKCTSTTSIAMGSGDKTFTVSSPGLGFVVGNYVYIVGNADNAKWMRGVVKSYSGTTLVVTVAQVGANDTYASWNIASAPFVHDTGGSNHLWFRSNAVMATNYVNATNPVWAPGYIYPAYLGTKPRLAEALVSAAVGGQPTVVSGSAMVEMAANEFVRFVVRQDSGSDLVAWSQGKTGTAWIMQVG